MTDHLRIVTSAPGRNRRRWRPEPGVTDWETFAAWLVGEGAGGGKYGRPYSPVTLREAPGRRLNVNLLRRHVLTLDADAAGPDYLDRLAAALPVASWSHTTASHAPDAPRWRTLVPLSRAAEPAEAKALATLLVGLVGRERFDLQASTSPVAVAYAPAWEGVEYHKQDGPVLDVDALLLAAPPVEWSPHDAAGAPTVDEFLDEHPVADLADLPDCRYGRAALEGVAADLAATVEGEGVHRAIFHAACRGVEMVRAGCWSVRDLDRLEDVALDLRAAPRPEEWPEALAGALAGGREPDTGCAEHAPDLFEATPTLAAIRQAAHSRGVPAYPVLAGCLSRVLLAVEPTVTLPPVVGGSASLNLGFVLLGTSGTAKTSSDDVAEEVLGWPAPDGWVLPIGSGEGMIDAFYAEAPTGPKGGRTLALTPDFDRHRLFTVDEGETLRKLTERSGTTLGPFLRTALTGGVLGLTNSKAGGHSRRVPARSYRLLMVVNLHPSQADILLAGDDVGTPQRFVWFPTDAGDLPERVDDLPGWPGDLGWEPPVGLASGDLEYPAAIAREIRQARLDAAHGRLHARQAHANLTRLKVAFALAALHGEPTITGRWWRLAGALVDRSLALQAGCAAALADSAQAARVRQEVGRARAEDAAADDRLNRAVVQVLDKVRERPVGERVSWHAARPGKALRDAVDKEDVLAAVARQAGFRVETGTGANGQDAVWVVRTA